MHDVSPDSGLLLTGSRVYTGDSAAPWAEAVVIRGEQIVYVGPQEGAHECTHPNFEEIHIPDGLIIPGLNDSHIHMTMGSLFLPTLNLEGTTTLEELHTRLREYADAHPEKEWIQGYGLPYEPLSDLDRSEREALDDIVGNRPVYVRAFDTHSAWCNSEALRRAGIERGADIPLPNEVVVDSTTGLATGMLKERVAHVLIEQHIDEPTQEERDHLLCHAMRYLNRLGITSVQNMDGDLARLEQYARLQDRGDLSVRAYHYMSVRPTTPREYLREVKEYTARFTDPWNHTSGIKLFIDGVVESKTALMLEPYSDGSSDTGVPDMDPTQYREIVVDADRLDMDVATHAIGDAGVRLTLDAYQAAQRANGGRRDRRHRTEHIEVIHPSDLPRFAQLGVTCSMQPLHAVPTTDPRNTPWTRLVGPQREPYAFSWRRLLETGAHLSFGSDWPIVVPDVRTGLHAAMTRRTVDGEPEGGWQPHLSVTLGQAIDAYTRGAAYIERQDHVKGMLRAGMAGDITVFAQDLFRLTPREILHADIALTVVGGRVVHRSL